MHFREQGRVLQMVRTTYDKAKGRGVQKVVAKMPLYCYEIPADVASELLSDELEQLRDYLAAVKAGRDHQDQELSLMVAAKRIDSITAAVNAGHEVRNADAIWSSMAELGKALKAAGHPKPVKPKKAPQALEGQTALDV
ncbi:hypothetical protein EHS17_15290 [Rhodobacteraceae bacterium CH30]|nr:hypothetical protein EHS17_15275 [Rhodobacteraceae bacterium CH30]RQW19577.1 hypothetical protein EHS17_15290 [Rhodobacteraceae bacterium CH30]